MSTEITWPELKDVLLRSAGAEEGVDLDRDDVLDQPFDALGYESLALMETVSAIERSRGITVDEEVVTEAETPRALIEVINEQLRAAA